MEFIRGIFEKANDFFGQFMGPIVDKIASFFASNEYFVIGIVGLFAALLVIVGLIRWLKKKFVLFLVITIICGAIVTLWALSR